MPMNHQSTIVAEVQRITCKYFRIGYDSIGFGLVRAGFQIGALEIAIESKFGHQSENLSV